MIEANQIVAAISVAIKGAKVEVRCPQNDRLHFDAIVISSHFKKKTRIARHQMALEPLKELFASNLHALTLKTYTPEEWEQKKNG